MERLLEKLRLYDILSIFLTGVIIMLIIVYGFDFKFSIIHFFYNIIQIKPLVPSLITLSIVS